MRSFAYEGQRVRVLPSCEPQHKGLAGKTGAVWRRRLEDRLAWVKMDEELPEELVSFSIPDDPRHTCVLLAPYECQTE